MKVIPNTRAPSSGAPPDGWRFCEAALADIKARKARGEKVRAVFDIDDTLSESRQRTLCLAKDWDTAHGTNFFSQLKISQVRATGFETAQALGLPAPLTRAFQEYWDVEFWKAERFVHDTPIVPMVKLAERARAAGAQVIFLTGRVDSLKEATIAQLRRFGLKDVTEKTVVSKEDLSVGTAQFKVKWLEQSANEGHHLAFFVTESRRDVAAIQQSAAGHQVVLLASPLGGRQPVSVTTLVIRR